MPYKFFLRTLNTLSLAAVALVATPAHAAWPDHPIRWVVAFTPGGIADVTARIVADRAAQSLGQPIVIENKGGGGGNIGAVTVARATPDGYTALVSTTSVVVNPALSPKTAYSVDRDLLPVAQIAASPNIIVATKSLGVQSWDEAIKRAPGSKWSFASPGVGSTSHLTGEYLFNIRSKADIVHAAYRGGGPAIADTIAGQTQFAVVPVPVALGHINAGTLQPLIVTGANRTDSLPDTPTAIEAGFADYVDATWVGVFLPAGAPPEAAERMNQAINEALADPAVAKRLQEQSLQKAGGSTKDFSQFVQREQAQWRKIVKETGVQVDE